MPASRAPGFSLVEILVVVTLIGILASIALPPLNGFLQRQRVRGVLDRFSTDLYHARMLALRGGERIHLRLEPGPDGCVDRYEVRRAATGAVLRRVDLQRERPLCLTSSGHPTISINARGMPAGAARTVRAVSGGVGDSLRISIVGRVNRLY